MTTTLLTCPCCLQPTSELRVIEHDGWAPDEPVCQECFYEYRDVDDETEFKDLKKQEV